jgi:hypothetical protein
MVIGALILTTTAIAAAEVARWGRMRLVAPAHREIGVGQPETAGEESAFARLQSVGSRPVS